MTAPNQVSDPLAGAGEAMSPEAVANMERRLLEAFSQHHHWPDRSGATGHDGWALLRRSRSRLEPVRRGAACTSFPGRRRL